jgi:hypothetical protein
MNIEGLQKAHDARERMRAEGRPIEVLSPLERARRKPTSFRLAINAKCFDCAGGSRNEVRRCPAVRCPLHALRPWQRDDHDDG